ncbi:unnamed protein product [Somion occarium]|uniref:Uncharacterized protein n=1 Tax=Somion occarium TaxID=3059160 RepID=A0ABP1D2C2_9APHY
MFEIEWDSNTDAHSRHRYPYRHKASTIHGWVTKLRGTLLDNEAVRRQGIREMQDAKRARQWRKQRKAERRMRSSGRTNGFLSLFTGSRSLKKRSPKRSQSTRAVVVHRDSSRHRSHKDKQPFMHFPNRTKPSHHGRGTVLRGYVMQDKKMISRGKSMNRKAARERDHERKRREKRREREARAMKRR